MKIAITGHTGGIGKGLFDLLSSHGHEVIGFSRSNGYNINDKKIRQGIINQIKDSDVFINNAYSGLAQVELLKDIIPLWTDTDKQIININSKASLTPSRFFTENYIWNIKYVNDHEPPEQISQEVLEFFNLYSAQKLEQVRLLSHHMFRSNPRILNIICGFVDTDMVKSWKFQEHMMKVPDVAELIVDLMKYKDRLLVQEITIDGIGIDYSQLPLDWKEIHQWVMDKKSTDAVDIDFSDYLGKEIIL